MMIVIFAWICLDEISERRKIGIILILSLLDNSYQIFSLNSVLQIVRVMFYFDLFLNLGFYYNAV